MGWIQILILIIRYGPTIVKLVRIIWDLINEIFSLHCDRNYYTEARQFRKAERQRLNDALAYYKRTGDDSKLKGMNANLTVMKNEFHNVKTIGLG